MNGKNNLLVNKKNLGLTLKASAAAVLLSLTSSANAIEGARSYTMSPPTQQLQQLETFTTRTNSLMQKELRKYQVQQQQVGMFADLNNIGGQLKGGLSLLAPISFVEMTPTQAQLMRDKGYTVEEDHLVEQIDILPSVRQQTDNLTWGVDKIRAPDVWQEGHTGSNIGVCIIDGGIQTNHSDLLNQVLVQKAWGGGLSAGSHGTHVAGTVAALDDNGGVVGVAPDANLLDADVFNGAFVQQSTFMEAVEWCVNQGARVINMSYGDPSVSNINYGAVHQAAFDAGTVLIAAAGNAGNGNAPLYPAAFPSVIAVNQSNSNDSLTGVGQNGELTAPGDGTYSTDLNNGYSTKSGTSMASPHVAGAAALLLSSDNSLTPSQVRSALVSTAVDIGSPSMAGAGRIDVKAALDSLGGPPVENQTPTASYSESCTELSCDFDASGSSDPDGSIVSYSWNFGDGSSGSGMNASHRYDSDGSYTVSLTVTDNEGAPNTTSSDIDVGVDVGSEQLNDGDSRTVATLPRGDWAHYYFDSDGSSYSDFTVTTAANNGDIDLYVLFEAEPTTGTYHCRDYSSDSNESCTINNLQQGRYHIGVKAYSATNNITVNLQATAIIGDNTPPTAIFTDSCSDLACSFDGSGCFDPDGKIASYSWNFGDGSSGNDSNPSHSYSASGSYTVTLTVTDFEGATGSTEQIVTVEGDNTPPTAIFDDNCSDLDCRFDGSDSNDPDGNIVSYSWTFGDGSSGNGSTPSHSYNVAGSYTVALTVTDNEGATGSSTETITVEIDNPGGTCSNVSAWSSSGNYSQGDQVTHNGRLYEKNWWFGNSEPGTGGSFSKWDDEGPCTSNLR